MDCNCALLILIWSRGLVSHLDKFKLLAFIHLTAKMKKG